MSKIKSLTTQQREALFDIGQFVVEWNDHHDAWVCFAKFGHFVKHPARVIDALRRKRLVAIDRVASSRRDFMFVSLTDVGLETARRLAAQR